MTVTTRQAAGEWDQSRDERGCQEGFARDSGWARTAVSEWYTWEARKSRQALAPVTWQSRKDWIGELSVRGMREQGEKIKGRSDALAILAISTNTHSPTCSRRTTTP